MIILRQLGLEQKSEKKQEARSFIPGFLLFGVIMSHPYRTSSLVTAEKYLYKRKTLFGWLKSFVNSQARKALIFYRGKFKHRFPFKCPVCKKQSWNPYQLQTLLFITYEEEYNI